MGIAVEFGRKPRHQRLSERKRLEMEHTTLTSRSESVSSAFRFSRYDPAWQDAQGRWPPHVWTELFDVVGQDVQLPPEYRAAEDLLSCAVAMCIGAAGRFVVVRELEVNGLIEARLKSIGAAIDLPLARPEGLDAAGVVKFVRASLRGQVWCELEGDHARCAVGHEMYVHVQADSISRALDLAVAVDAVGLFTQPAEYPWVAE
jgi:hypothetical protein